MSKPSVKSDLYQAIFPIYHLSKASGLLPIRFVYQTTGRYLGRIHLIDIIYRYTVSSVCLLIFFIGTEIWGLWRDLRDGWENSTRLKHQTAVNVTIGDVVAVAVLASVGVLGAPFRWKYIQEIIARLVQADDRLGYITPRKTRKFTIILTTCVLTFFIMLSCLDIYTWDFSTKMKRKMPDKGPINYSPIYFLYIQALLIEIHCTIATYNLNERFIRLNKNLENLLKSQKNNQENKVTMTSEIASTRLGGRVLRAPKVSERTSEETRNMADAITQLLSVHASLCDTNVLINKAFGLPILVVAITCLLHLIITPYFLMMEANSDKGALFIVVQILWCGLHILRMLIVVQPCYATTTQSKLTAILVSRLLTYNWEPQVGKQLELFSLQLLHRPLDFSACGLFSLDRALVTSMAGAVTTYLVILIQFQKADDQKDLGNIIKNSTLLLKNVSSLHNITGLRLKR